MNPEDNAIDEVRRYYTAKVEQHGATALGADWRDEASQEARFKQLELLMAGDLSGSLADIGCGYGALARFLRAHGWHGHYEGVDISDSMIEAARKFLATEKDVRLTVGQEPAEKADYIVASGIFNVKIAAKTAAWEEHVFSTIDAMVSWARKGVAFNCLTSWSDAPLMRNDLFYAAPERILEYCAARHSRWIEISQDYGLFEFTVRMRFDRDAPAQRLTS
jgi:SAM-dependent methyltransferase